MRPSGELEGVKIFEFDKNFRMTAIMEAERADYRGSIVWQLTNVMASRFPSPDSAGFIGLRSPVKTTKSPAMELVSEITPDILGVLFADPDRMSATDLASYTRHLEENNQRSDRYQIAFWKKLIYPFAVFVMMALALPFAYMNVRSGGISIGVSFQLSISLFSLLGLLNTWPPVATAALPSALFLLAAIGALLWVERHRHERQCAGAVRAWRARSEM